MSEFWKKMKASKTMHFFKIVSESATFALFLSIIFFGWEMFDNMQESKEMTDNLNAISTNLVDVQNSLSTRYLGEFPDFLPDIKNLYAQAQPGDSIVILEDVLFYGITSAPKEFYEASGRLLELADQGSPVMISYYKHNGLAYNMTVQEWLLSPECYKNYRDTMQLFRQRSQLYHDHKKVLIDSCARQKMPKEETDRLIVELLKQYFVDVVGQKAIDMQAERIVHPVMKPDNMNPENVRSARKDDNAQVRDLLLERFFAKTRDADKKQFMTMVNKYRRPTVEVAVTKGASRREIETLKMCQKMDSIRVKYLGKEDAPINHLTYADFMKMYQEMTDVMQHTYEKYPSIKLVPIDDFLSVRSWLVCNKKGDSQAIMAFPSRYSSSEIGFYTTDESTRNYIKTMQRGILINYSKE